MRNLLSLLALGMLVALAVPLPARAQAGASLTVQNFSPTSVTAGTLADGKPLYLIVTGTGFTSQMTATLSSPTLSARPLEVTVDSTGTHATLVVRFPLLKDPATLTIVLANPSSAKSVSIAFTVAAPIPPNPVPILSSLSPGSNGPPTITLTGKDFAPNATVAVGQYTATPTSQSSTSVTVSVPTSAFSATAITPVTVINPAPGGGASNVLAFHPFPTVTSVTPSYVSSSTNQVVTVSGTGIGPYTTGSIATPQGSIPGTVSGSTMVFQVSVSGNLDLSGTIQNPSPGGGTAPFALVVGSPAPTLNPVEGSLGKAPQLPLGAGGTGSYTISLFGQNLLPTTVVSIKNETGIGFNFQPVLVTTFISSTQLSAILPAALLEPGFGEHICVANSSQQTCTTFDDFAGYTPVQLSSATPTTIVRSSGNAQVILNGSGFYNTTKVYGIQTNAIISAQPTLLSFLPTSETTNLAVQALLGGLRVFIPASLQNGGSVTLTAANPNGPTSNPITIPITNP